MTALDTRDALDAGSLDPASARVLATAGGFPVRVGLVTYLPAADAPYWVRRERGVGAIRARGARRMVDATASAALGSADARCLGIAGTLTDTIRRGSRRQRQSAYAAHNAGAPTVLLGIIGGRGMVAPSEPERPAVAYVARTIGADVLATRRAILATMPGASWADLAPETRDVLAPYPAPERRDACSMIDDCPRCRVDTSDIN